jgi:hypothetical protein
MLFVFMASLSNLGGSNNVSGNGNDVEDNSSGFGNRLGSAVTSYSGFNYVDSEFGCPSPRPDTGNSH